MTTGITKTWQAGWLLAAVLLCAGLSLTAQTSPDMLSKAQVKALLADAEKPENSRQLAVYYRTEEQLYRAKAKAESEEHELALAKPWASPKFPTRADIIARLRDYYEGKANSMAAAAARYEAVVQPASADRMQVATATPAVATPLSANEVMLLQRIEQLEKQVRASGQ